MGEQLYPRPRKERDKSGRLWRVEYALAYDDGGAKWIGYYRTKFGARHAAFWHVNVRSWGGTAVLFKNK